MHFKGNFFTIIFSIGKMLVYSILWVSESIEISIFFFKPFPKMGILVWLSYLLINLSKQTNTTKTPKKVCLLEISFCVTIWKNSVET